MTGLIQAVNTQTGLPALIPAHYLQHPTFGKHYKEWEHGKKTLITPATEKSVKGAGEPVPNKPVTPTETTEPKRRASLAKKED